MSEIERKGKRRERKRGEETEREIMWSETLVTIRINMREMTEMIEG